MSIAVDHMPQYSPVLSLPSSSHSPSISRVGTGSKIVCSRLGAARCGQVRPGAVCHGEDLGLGRCPTQVYIDLVEVELQRAALT